ncbi:alpha/beta hydrolase family protein [Paenibacillus ginsengarvi]|uniref:Dipeptidyl aminopeptidase n=1 Tax=Paenibacillus ginsengarvi TaxID=400777 RepID=A0A3B0AUH8_9BACL|nr:dipeptidyl aminopeptidase [Paenibacillus ginsengarvi]RKN64178.1 dipeptidyl aminopeptidase [Paenibacillus ginsengarvi]
MLSKAEFADHSRLHIRYGTANGDEVTAYLLHPSDLRAEPLPAVLALHPTVGNGKEDTATVQGRNNRRYGLELAQRGYVVLAPDTITAGERASSLCALPEVDPGRIGAIGHSLGGYNSFFLAGLDDRVRAFVSSCGFCTFAGDPTPNRWGHRDWFSHIPRLTEDLNRGEVPFEFHEIAALAAPIPAFYYSGQQDLIFPNWQSYSQGMERLFELYRLLDKADSFHYVMTNGGHDFPDAVRQMAYAFLDRHLGKE